MDILIIFLEINPRTGYGQKLTAQVIKTHKKQIISTLNNAKENIFQAKSKDPAISLNLVLLGIEEKQLKLYFSR